MGFLCSLRDESPNFKMKSIFATGLGISLSLSLIFPQQLYQLIFLSTIHRALKQFRGNVLIPYSIESDFPIAHNKAPLNLTFKAKFNMAFVSIPRFSCSQIISDFFLRKKSCGHTFYFLLKGVAEVFFLSTFWPLLTS